MTITGADVLACYRSMHREEPRKPMRFDEFWFRQVQFRRFLESLAREWEQSTRANLGRATGWADG